MPHDLLITYEIKVEDKFRPFLKSDEAVRGEPCKLTVYVTNLGKKRFSGGVGKEFRIEYGAMGFRHLVRTPEELPNCPALDPGEKQIIISEVQVPGNEGLASIKIKFEAEDKQPIKYYQTPKGTPLEGDEWRNFIYVVSREQISTIMLLEQLLKRSVS